MKEVKVILAPYRKLMELDGQDSETLEKLENEEKVLIRVEMDDNRDEIIPGADGKVTRCRTVTLNGVQWFIPVETMVKVPVTIRNMLRKTLSPPKRIKPGMRRFDKTFQVQLS